MRSRITGGFWMLLAAFGLAAGTQQRGETLSALASGPTATKTQPQDAVCHKAPDVDVL